MNTALTDAFGSGKVNAELVDGKLSFSTTSENDQLAISSSAASVLGFDNSTNYLSTSEKLGDLLDFDALVADGTLTANTDGTYDFYLNDTLIGSYDKDTTLSSVLSDINGSDLGIKASYSTLSKSFVFSTKETGSSQKIEMGAGLAQAMFGVSEDGSTDGTYSAGKDAEFVVTVNGEQLSMSRSTNTVDMDGMKLTFSKEFSASYTTDAAGNKVYDTSESVSFTSKADADTIVESITKMVAEYNVMMSEIKSAYSTTPLTQSNGEAYEPLTDDDMADMSDSAIEKYEKKAKTGLLFGDRDLSSLYQKLRFVFSPSGEDGDLLRQMGISTSYSSSDGALTVTVDESKLRSMLETNPDAVTEVFTKTAANDGEDGIMQKIKTQLDAYGATTGATKGILVQKAGSPLSSLSLLDNTYQKQIESLNEQIEDWQDKLSNKVDYYTNQFSRLEVLINQMNSQSSMLSGLSGGY